MERFLVQSIWWMTLNVFEYKFQTRETTENKDLGAKKDGRI